VVDPCEGYFLNIRPERGEKMRIKFPGKITQTFKIEEAHLRLSHLHFQKKSVSKKLSLPQEIAHKKMVHLLKNSRSYFRLTMCYCG